MESTRNGPARLLGQLGVQLPGQPAGVLALVGAPDRGQVVPILVAAEQLLIKSGVELGLRQMEKRNVRERRERYSLPAFLIKTPHSYASRIRRTTRKDTSLRRLPDIGHYSPTFGAAQCPCVLRRTSGLYRAPAFRHAVPHSRFALKIHVQSCDAAPRPVVAVVIRSAAVLIHNGAAAQRERFLKFRARACESR